MKSWSTPASDAHGVHLKRGLHNWVDVSVGRIDLYGSRSTYSINRDEAIDLCRFLAETFQFSITTRKVEHVQASVAPVLDKTSDDC